MKLSILALVLATIVATHAVRLGGAPDLLAKPGECASGLPRDGRFAKCGLGDWKVGSTRLFKAVNTSDISFGDDFAKGWKEDFSSSDNSSSSCSASIPGNAVLYQRLTDDILYAHYRLRACARVLGNTPCAVVVKSARNEIYDKLEFRPDSDLGCSAPSRGPRSPDCISSCNSVIESITVRYEGLLPGRVSVRCQQLGVEDWILVGDFARGDEVSVNLDNISAWFNSSVAFLPDVEVQTIYGNNVTVIDAVSLNCSTLSAYPGQRLGDKGQFFIISLSASEGDFCSWSDLANRHTDCTCDKSASAREICMFSDKGFVADPAEQFYIGLESESCGCSFDNICLEQVNGYEGYFGLDWILHEEESSGNKNDSDSNSDSNSDSDSDSDSA